MKKIVLFLIRIYQKTLSYDHGILGKIFPNTRYCKFTPTCSEYTYTAVERYGIFKGLCMGAERLSRCNSKTPAGTYDPVPEKE
jgi:hypothetical protein